MTERQQLHRRNGRAARSGTRAAVRWRSTAPTELPPPASTADDLTLLGFPAELEQDPPEQPETAVDVEPADRDALRAVRRPDGSAGSLLLVAGAAGVLSLFLPWVHHQEQLGVSLVRHAMDLGARGVAEILRMGAVLPLVVAAGGGVLFLLGLLAFRPASTHRFTGVVALFVSLAVAAGVVVRVADADSNAVLTDPGILCAVVLAAVGLLGALKAMLTAPEFTTDPD
jgi:hypothetical protein